MKKFLIVISLFLGLVSQAFADVTLAKKIERIQVQGQGTGNPATYYFFSTGGWGSENCPNAVYAYINENESGAKAILGLAMSAKAMGTIVKFLGTCKADKSYIHITYMYQY